MADNYDQALIDTQKDKYLTFHLAGEYYALEISHVTEIIGIQIITEVPDMPKYLKGVINLRGKIIPVLDIRLRFHIAPIEYGARTCIIVVKYNEVSVGLIVDEVSEVLDIKPELIDPAPKTMKGTQSKFMKGFGKVGESVKILLDLDALLNDKELDNYEYAPISN